MAASTTPETKNGFLRPHRVQVRSLSTPITGWITSPVMGPARLSSGRSCGFAPIMANSGLMAVCCRPIA